MESIIAGMGFLSILFFIVGIFIAILWTLLPFAVFGIKNRLDKIITQLEMLNSKFSNIEKEFIKINNTTELITKLQIKNNITNNNNENLKKYMPK